MLGVEELINPADTADNAFEFALAHAFCGEINRLEFNMPLLEEALCFFGIKAFGFAENLNIHHKAPLAANACPMRDCG